MSSGISCAYAWQQASERLGQGLSDCTFNPTGRRIFFPSESYGIYVMTKTPPQSRPLQQASLTPSSACNLDISSPIDSSAMSVELIHPRRTETRHNSIDET